MMLWILYQLWNYCGLFKSSGMYRVCSATGAECKDQCIPDDYGVHQWCGSCIWYISCTSGTTIYHACPEGTVFDDAYNNCRSTSLTCWECTVDIGGTTPAPPPDGRDWKFWRFIAKDILSIEFASESFRSFHKIIHSKNCSSV